MLCQLLSDVLMLPMTHSWEVPSWLNSRLRGGWLALPSLTKRTVFHSLGRTPPPVIGQHREKEAESSFPAPDPHNFSRLQAGFYSTVYRLISDTPFSVPFNIGTNPRLSNWLRRQRVLQKLDLFYVNSYLLVVLSSRLLLHRNNSCLLCSYWLAFWFEERSMVRGERK